MSAHGTAQLHQPRSSSSTSPPESSRPEETRTAASAEDVQTEAERQSIVNAARQNIVTSVADSRPRKRSFRRALQNIPVSPEAQLKWDRMRERGIRTFISHHTEAFTRRVHRGIPQTHRWAVWKAAVQYDERYLQGAYQKLIAHTSKWQQNIEMDVSRTFPDVEDFDQGYEQALARLLSAYSNLNQDVGYCQGLNFIGGLMLLVSECNEEETFWVLVCLLEFDGLHGFYKEKFPLLRRYLKALNMLVRKQLPKLHAHFIAESMQPGLYLHQWFLKLFVDCLPLETVLLIWDTIICDGLPVMLSITVALLSILEPSLLRMKFEEIVSFFRTMRAGDEDADATKIGQLLIKEAMNIKLTEEILTVLKEDLDDDETEHWQPEQAARGSEMWWENLPSLAQLFPKVL